VTLFRPAVPLLVVALALAACAVPGPPSRATASPAATAAPASSPTGAPESLTPETEAPSETEPPAETEAPAETEPPAETPEPVESPAATEPGGSAAAGADACTGTDDNRSFLEAVAGRLEWTVLCAVLPARWSVVRGEYRLANGGRMVMSYKGPGGATLVLSEGAFCRDADGCVPPGTDTGDAALGPMTGTLVALDDGGWAIVADRGEKLSWLLEAQGLDEAATRSIGAALVEVGG
jgi:hypothetical protein